MGVSTLACTYLGMRLYDIHAWVSASFFDDMVSYDLNSGFTNRSPRFLCAYMLKITKRRKSIAE